MYGAYRVLLRINIWDTGECIFLYILFYYKRLSPLKEEISL